MHGVVTHGTVGNGGRRSTVKHAGTIAGTESHPGAAGEITRYRTAPYGNFPGRICRKVYATAAFGCGKDAIVYFTCNGICCTIPDGEAVYHQAVCRGCLPGDHYHVVAVAGRYGTVEIGVMGGIARTHGGLGAGKAAIEFQRPGHAIAAVKGKRRILRICRQHSNTVYRVVRAMRHPYVHFRSSAGISRSHCPRHIAESRAPAQAGVGVISRSGVYIVNSLAIPGCGQQGKITIIKNF